MNLRARYLFVLAALFLWSDGTVTAALSATESEGAESSRAAEWWRKSIDALDNAYQSATDLLRSQERDPDFAALWEHITPKLDSVLELQERREDLPDSAWIREDKADNQHRIDALLDEAIEILGVSRAGRLRSQMADIAREIAAARERIDAYKKERVSAPLKSPWRTTVEEYDQRIRDEEERIEDLSAEATVIRQDLGEELRQIGLELSDQQLELLLASVVGDDVIHGAVAFENVKAITDQLMQLMAESDESPEIARRYYGMYTVLIGILLRMQERFMADIDERYLPGVDGIVHRSRAVEAQSRQLLAGESDRRRVEHLRSNLRAQDLTRKTAKLYREHLLIQRQKVKQAHKRLGQEHQVAVNTYETVKLSSELMRILRSSQESFSALVSLQLPELVVFENVQIRDEFAKLTRFLNART
jgi:hypothetical protein